MLGVGGGRVGGGGQGGCEAMLGVGGDVGYGRCEPRIEDLYCTMYKKVLYNIKKIKKKCGGGAIIEPKTLSMYLKKKPEDQWSCKRPPDILA